MAFQSGTQVRPELGRMDFSGYARAGELYGQAFQQLGQQISGAIQQNRQKKKEKEESKARVQAAMGLAEQLGISDFTEDDAKELEKAKIILPALEMYSQRASQQAAAQAASRDREIANKALGTATEAGTGKIDTAGAVANYTQLGGANPDQFLKIAEGIRKGQAGSGSGASLKQAGEYVGRDGETYQAVVHPDRGLVYKDRQGAFIDLPHDAMETFAGSGLSGDKLVKMSDELTVDENAMRKANEYFGSLEDARQGYKLLADKVTGGIQTLLDRTGLSDKQLAAQIADGKLQALIGANRVDIVGPGVLTEQDALRVIAALGGKGALRNKEVAAKMIQDIIENRERLYRTRLGNYNRAVKNSPAGLRMGLQPREKLDFSIHSSESGDADNQSLPQTPDDDLERIYQQALQF